MESSPHTLPTSPLFPSTFEGSLQFSSSPQQSCSNGRLLLPLSPTSLPPSPASLSPATAESIQSSSPLSHCATSQCFDGQNVQALGLPDQDDLTCLSWLHQRSDLLPLQPIVKTNPLPQLELCLESPRPACNVTSKPPYSFSSLIFMAIEDSPYKRLPVKDIYEWIENNFPYYRSATGGWRNSVRHNLSLSKSFRRIQRDKNQVGDPHNQPQSGTASTTKWFCYEGDSTFYITLNLVSCFFFI